MMTATVGQVVESPPPVSTPGYGASTADGAGDLDAPIGFVHGEVKDMYRSLTDYADAAVPEGDDDLNVLLEAERRSVESIREMRAFISEELRGTDGVDIVAFGSLARREWTSASDFDYLVMVHGVTEPSTLRKTFKVAEKARSMLEANEPGSSGMFGTIVSATELTARIGLETDTNQTMTRRLLMLEESVSLYDLVEHERFMGSMFDRYLVEYRNRSTKTGAPRFLLNDVVRHWRTVAVDYQAKNWQRVTDEGWGLRYLKLRLSRKLAYAGTLAPLLQIALEGKELLSTTVHNSFVDPPLVRLSRLHEFLHSEGKVALLDAMRIAGQFNRRLNDEGFRDRASKVVDKEDCDDDDFLACIELSSDLQRCLSEIFLGADSPLKPISEQYLIF